VTPKGGRGGAPERLDRRAFLAILAALFPVAATAADGVRVASKLDTESALLGNMILLALEADGIPTVDRLQLGPTNILRSAIIAGEIDVYPEYTGNGALFYAAESDPVWRDRAAGFAQIRALDAEHQHLAWLDPAPADNSWVIVVPRELAAEHRLRSLVDFAGWIGRGGRARLAASAEFVESAAALPAFEAAYGFTLAPSQLLVLAGGDTAVTTRAAAEGISGVNAAMAYGTDGALSVLGLVVLEDPKRAQVVYAPAPVVRAPVLEKFPAMRDRLAAIFRSLDEASLRRLNARVAVDGEKPRDVARTYLGSIAERR
jgi:osmoprotectant transport system substrate-binding protein